MATVYLSFNFPGGSYVLHEYVTDMWYMRHYSRGTDGYVDYALPSPVFDHRYTDEAINAILNTKGVEYVKYWRASPTPRNHAAAPPSAGDPCGAVTPSPPTRANYQAQQTTGAGQLTVNATSIKGLALGAVPFDIVPPDMHPALPLSPRSWGELIGHRVWRYSRSQNELLSCSATYRWIPGKIAEANFGGDEFTTIHCGVEDRNVVGFWAFKDPYHLALEFQLCNFYIYGTVWLWGTVIEHELGYRGQFATVRSLEYTSNPAIDLDALRARYCPKDNP